MRPVSQQGRVATLLLEGGLGLEDALDDGSLLDEESAGDALLDAARADGAAVGARNGLLALREAGVLAGAEGGDTGEGLTAVTALGGRLERTSAKNVSRAGRRRNPHPPRENLRTASFLMWWTTSLPPGVFTTLLRLEEVL
jgi:hypothetical protein